MTQQRNLNGQKPLIEEGYVIGADIGATNLRLVLADMTGTVVARFRTSTAGIRSAEAVMEMVCDAADKLLNEVGAERCALRAIAAGAPGVTDVDAGVVIATSYLMGWRDVPLRAMLESALGVPAAVDNDVNMAVLGESWAGAGKGTRDFVFLAIGTGIGAGILLNGSLFHGTGWSAGEIGYMLVPGVSEEPVKSHEPGALEEAAGGEGLRKHWRSLWNAERTSHPQDMTATQIFEAAAAGDTLARGVLERAARVLAYTIYDISLVLSCPLFVLGGSVGLHPVLCDAIREIMLARSARGVPRLERSMLGTDAQLIGAVRLALDTARSAVPA
jgi:glucokinase